MKKVNEYKQTPGLLGVLYLTVRPVNPIRIRGAVNLRHQNGHQSFRQIEQIVYVNGHQIT